VQRAAKIPDLGHFISLDGMNYVFSFNKYTKHKYFFFHFSLLTCDRKIYPKNIMACPTRGFARLGGGGLQPSQPSSPVPCTPTHTEAGNNCEHSGGKNWWAATES